MFYLLFFIYLSSSLFAMSGSQAKYYSWLKMMETDGRKASFLKTDIINGSFSPLDREGCLSLAKSLNKTDGTFMTLDKNGNFFSTYNRTEIDLYCHQGNPEKSNRLYVFNTGDQREMYFKYHEIRSSKGQEVIIIENEDMLIAIQQKSLSNRVFYVFNKDKKNFILSNRTLTNNMPLPIKDLHKSLLSD